MKEPSSNIGYRTIEHFSEDSLEHSYLRWQMLLLVIVL